MLDLFNLPSGTTASEQFYYEGYGDIAGQEWFTWYKPRGKTMVNIILVGKGANGGTGVVGANTLSAGGGGGGSGGQTHLTMPLALIPDILYISLAGVVTGSQILSYITIMPRLTAGAGTPAPNDTLMIAYGGTVGGNAAANTAGAGGLAGAIATVGLMPLGWPFATLSLAGQAGIIGGVSGANGAALTIPVTGLYVTGGTGGGGLAGAAAAGTTGGSFTVAGSFPPHNAPAAVAVGTATVPPEAAAGGYRPQPKMLYGYGGLGSGSTHGTALTTGLVQAAGGNGAPGCGGGGMGGALTGSAAAAVSLGGAAWCLITVW